jgi:hypothetical protein
MESYTQDNLNTLLSVLNDMGYEKGRSVISNYDTYLRQIRDEKSAGGDGDN